MLDWALATEPRNRYPTAQEFALDLSMLIAAEPVDPVEPTVTDPVPPAEFVSQTAPTVADAGPARKPQGGNPSNSG